MKWFTYLKHTPLAQMRADWSEYMGLWRKCATLGEMRNAAYNKIVMSVNGHIEKSPVQSCIVQTFYCLPVGRTGNDGIDNKVWIKQSICRKFHEISDGVKCDESSCPCIAANHEYSDACVLHSLMCKARRDFWRVKFIQATQRKK